MVQQQKLNKFSIVIPTLFKVLNLTERLILSLVEDEAVGEVIIINNTDYWYDLKHDKIKIVNCYHNIFVNPAWNLGVELANFEYVALLNDDILVPNNFFSNLLDFNIDAWDLLGYNATSCEIYHNQNELTLFDSEITEIAYVEERPFNYGVLMVCRKDKYKEIPKEYKIWCGDDYLFYNSHCTAMIDCKLKIMQSATSNLEEFYEQENTDLEIYKKSKNAFVPMVRLVNGQDIRTKRIIRDIEVKTESTNEITKEPTISLCMIVRDAEESIARCIASIIDGVDEVIIVDTGSVDDTKRIVKLFGDKIKLYDFTWIGDFATARNYAFSKATMDYQMWLDADDVITGPNLAKLIKAKKTFKADLITSNYNTTYNSNGEPLQYMVRERFFKRNRDFKWVGRIHECIALEPGTDHIDFEVNHISTKTKLSTRNLDIYKDMISKNEEFTPRDTFYYARELQIHSQYDEALNQFLLFLNQEGIREDDAISSCESLCDIALHKNDSDSALMFLYRTFNYDAPRNNICAKIGDIYKSKNKYKSSIFWFELSIAMKERVTTFSSSERSKIYSLIELCYLYSQIGDMKKSKMYHDKCKQIEPNHPSVVYNENYFNSLTESIN